jgi:AraC-like DNA-binding protein
VSYRYDEIAPAARLAPYVECFWSIKHGDGAAGHRVPPDGCIDLLFTRRAGEGPRVQVVGTMTQTRLTAAACGDACFGVRFRPGMSTGFVPVPAHLITDQIVELEDILGQVARRLSDQLGEAHSTAEQIEIMTAHLAGRPEISPAQRAIGWLTAQGGMASVQDLARQAGLSERQFRRVCLELSGLPPKRLARVLRFRNTLAHLQARPKPNMAQLAAECGYYDQAHFIHDFQELAGHTPGQYAAASA